MKCLTQIFWPGFVSFVLAAIVEIYMGIVTPLWDEIESGEMCMSRLSWKNVSRSEAPEW